MLERWVRMVLRHRAIVVGAWIVVLALGAFSASRLPGHLSISFDVPGTDSARAKTILEQRFGDRTDGSFTIVFPIAPGTGKEVKPQLERRVQRAAQAVPSGRRGELRAGEGIFYATITTRLGLQEAARYTEAIRAAARSGSGPPASVTGQPAIQHDFDPVIRSDTRRGEALALPVACLVLLIVLGLSLATLVPFAFAACSIAATLSVVYLLTQWITMATYLPILVELIGLGLAIDYSLLVVYRFREELGRHREDEEAVVRTMATAGRTVLASGTAVAIGLTLLLFMPVPFIRSMGIGGLLVPLASMAAMLTLQPVLLSLLGRRGARRVPVAPTLRRRLGLPLPQLPGTRDVEQGTWARLSRAIMRRPVPFLVGATALLVMAAVPAAFIQLTPGSLSGLPQSLESAEGYTLLRSGVAPGVITPTQIVVDTGTEGGARAPAVRQALDRLGNRLFQDFELVGIARGPKPPYVDESRRYARIVTAGVSEYGARATQDYVGRVREEYVPASRFPAGTTVAVGGAPAEGVDFLGRAYGSFPWLVVVALALTFCVLLRAFRSIVLPLKAVLLNVLTVAAVYGLLVALFSWSWGSGHLGLPHVDGIDGWIPIFLFAVLFGLSMDYEVFVVSRMRESWDHVPDNARAVAHGLERTGRIVTAAAAIMVAAFLGFTTGHIVALQELGVGLALAVLIDATLVRAILVPSLMAVMGRYNWWLPAGVARVFRVAPSPLAPAPGTGSLSHESAP